MIWLIALGAWTAVSVAVGLVLGPALKRCSRPAPPRLYIEIRPPLGGPQERYGIAGGWLRRAPAPPGTDDALAADLAAAFRAREVAEPVARTAGLAWQQREAAS